MDLATFIRQRRPQWRQLETILQRVEGSGMRTLDADQAGEFLLPSTMPMIQPTKEGEEANESVASTGQLAEFSSHLFQNNMSATLFAFALGITLGIGTIWLMWYNGIIIGALAAVFFEAGQ